MFEKLSAKIQSYMTIMEEYKNEVRISFLSRFLCYITSYFEQSCSVRHFTALGVYILNCFIHYNGSYAVTQSDFSHHSLTTDNK